LLLLTKEMLAKLSFSFLLLLLLLLLLLAIVVLLHCLPELLLWLLLLPRVVGLPPYCTPVRPCHCSIPILLIIR
jgi:hypothetical protein